jgi:hypothetical protein
VERPEQHDQRDQLPNQDHPVQVERWLPLDVPIADDIRPDGGEWWGARAPEQRPHEARNGNKRHAVLLQRLTKHLGRFSLLGTGEQLTPIHRDLLPEGSQGATAGAVAWAARGSPRLLTPLPSEGSLRVLEA